MLAVASALAFSSSGPFIKPLLEAGWSLGAALLVRMGVAGLILSPALFLAIRRQRGFLRRHWRLILGFGLMPVLGCQLFFFSAMQRMPVAVALLIQYLAPVMLVAFVWLRTRRAPSRARAVGLGRRGRRARARRRHLGRVVRPARHAVRARRGGVRVRLLRDLRARRRRSAAARPRRRRAADRRRRSWRSCASPASCRSRLPRCRSCSPVSRCRGSCRCCGSPPSRRRSATRSASWRCRASARASRRSSGCPRCCSRSGSPGSSSPRCRLRSSSPAAR